MLKTATLVAALACAVVQLTAQNDSKKDDWIQLFNGRNLDG